MERTTILFAIIVTIMVCNICDAHYAAADMWAEPANDAAVDTDMSIQHLQTMANFLHRHLRTTATRTIAEHASLLQTVRSPRKFSHSWKKSQDAIRKALGMIDAQLLAGHHNDDNISINTAHFENTKVIGKALEKGKKMIHSIKNKSCSELYEFTHKTGKVTGLSSTMKKLGTKSLCSDKKLADTWTFEDMEVHKSVPAFGSYVRSQWTKIRTKYVKAYKEYAAAEKAKKEASAKYAGRKASIRTALFLEARNIYKECKAAHAEYNKVMKEVLTNAKMRKQVWIAILTVKCYADHTPNSPRAKRCADNVDKSDLSRWDISPKKLIACQAPATLADKFGPATWRPSLRKNGTCKGKIARKIALMEAEAHKSDQAVKHKAKTVTKARAPPVLVLADVKDKTKKGKKARERAVKAKKSAVEKLLQKGRELALQAAAVKAKERGEKKELKDAQKKEKAEKAARKKEQAAFSFLQAKAKEKSSKKEHKKFKELDSKETKAKQVKRGLTFI